MSDSPSKDDQLDEAFAAYLRSCDAGEVASREEFLSQFPDLADELKQLIEAADMIGQVTLTPKPKAADSGAETLGASVPSEEDSWDPAATLPMSHRPKGDKGPTLPFDLGDYMLLEIIGRGGMGVVYLAKQMELDREVAVKMIRSGMLADDAEVRRFYTEAQAAARLHHPGIVSVHQFGRRAGHHFFSMEHIRGTDLQRRLNDGELDPELAARYVRDVANAIHHAHEKGVLHRDLKPANVLIDERDEVHVTDFGLAKHLDSDSSVTGSGAAVGTPHYMAPEQAVGQSDRASRCSDIYSLGAILFACLTGRPPIVGDTVMQTLVQVAHEPAPAVRSLRRDVPVDLETIIAKCLEKDPRKRYQSAENLADELDRYLEGRPIEARPRSRAIKAWHWIEGVPLVGALTGRRVLHSSTLHRRFQAGMLMIMLLTPIFIAAFLLHREQQEYAKRYAMPSVVRIAGGVTNGLYNQISSELGNRIEEAHGVEFEPVPSSGSIDNLNHLLAGRADVAPMQSTVIQSEKIKLVAPLFHELVYVLAREGSDIRSLDDLRSLDIAVGSKGSASHQTAALILNELKLDDSVRMDFREYGELNGGDAPDAAIICIGRGSELVRGLIVDDGWQLIPIPRDDEAWSNHLSISPMAIHAHDEFGPDVGPIKDVQTVGTTAFLATRDNVPDKLIEAVLSALYQEPQLHPGLLGRGPAGEQHRAQFHASALNFFDSHAP